MRLRLNWMYYGSHAPFALGKDKGYFKDAGINLDIRSGNGSGSAHRLVANGDSHFSYGSCASMMNLAARARRLISVGVIDAMGTEAIIVRPDAGREDDHRSQGQDAAHHGQCRREHVLPARAEECRPHRGRRQAHQRAGRRAGVELSAGRRRRGRHARRPRRQAGRDQGQWRRAEPVTFAYSDFGVNQVGYCIVTTKEMVENNPIW